MFWYTHSSQVTWLFCLTSAINNLANSWHHFSACSGKFATASRNAVAWNLLDKSKLRLKFTLTSSRNLPPMHGKREIEIGRGALYLFPKSIRNAWERLLWKRPIHTRSCFTLEYANLNAMTRQKEQSEVDCTLFLHHKVAARSTDLQKIGDKEGQVRRNCQTGEITRTKEYLNSRIFPRLLSLQRELAATHCRPPPTRDTWLPRYIRSSVVNWMRLECHEYHPDSVTSAREYVHGVSRKMGAQFAARSRVKSGEWKSSQCSKFLF